MGDENLGLNLNPGDDHYRAYVGPPADYDLIAAMVFNLLTTLGLRQHQKVLDIGCGSLRVGRLLIPYLNQGGYTGVEPNRWLLDDGIRCEVGEDQVGIKKPNLLVGDSPDVLGDEADFDFAVAQSIFSHAGLDLMEGWLRGVHDHLQPGGCFAATFLTGDVDFEGKGWVYPGCVKFRVQTIAQLAEDCGYHFKMLNWYHPRQSWCVFYRESFDASWIDSECFGWNQCYQR